MASQDIDSLLGEQQPAAQNYRPYYNNRRPAFPVRRPAYTNAINQKPQTPVSSNYRPAPTVAQSTKKPNTESGTTCSSSNNYQQYGICWAADSQRLQISPSLTIENLVRFHKANLFSSQLYQANYRQQLCEQSRRFNSVGLLCVSTGEDDCVYKRGNNVYTSAAQSCYNDDCICVVGEPYETIASQTVSVNSPFNAPQFQPGYWQSWTAGLNQDIQNTLAAHGIYWRP